MSDLRMPDLRCVTVAGRLGHTPELKHAATGTAMCRLSLAVSCYRGRDAEKETLWLDVDCFGVTAELAAKLGKGAPVIIEGNLDVSRWKGKDGEEKSKVVVKASRIQRLEWADDANETHGEHKRAEVAEPAMDDDIPF